MDGGNVDTEALVRLLKQKCLHFRKRVSRFLMIWIQTSKLPEGER